METKNQYVSLHLDMFPEDMILTLVNNQRRNIEPSFASEKRFAYPACKHIGRFLAYTNTSKRMYGAATDVETCDSS